MTDLQVKYHAQRETERSNRVKENLTQEEVDIKRQGLEYDKMRAEAALKQAAAAGKQAEVAKWNAIINGIDKALTQFTLSPMSQSEFFKNVGQGFGSSAQGVKSLFGGVI